MTMYVGVAELSNFCSIKTFSIEINFVEFAARAWRFNLLFALLRDIIGWLEGHFDEFSFNFLEWPQKWLKFILMIPLLILIGCKLNCLDFLKKMLKV